MRLFFWFVLWSFGSTAYGAGFFANGVYDTGASRFLELEEFISTVVPGTVLVVGESHGVLMHQLQQRELLRRLGGTVSFALEHLDFLDQEILTQWVRGEVDNEAFKEAVGWSDRSLERWGVQLRYPLSVGGASLAPNTPRPLAAQVARLGLEGLPAKARRLIPPNFQPGSKEYWERFKKMMSDIGHGFDADTADAEAQKWMRRYFLAQSLKDSTMAWFVGNFAKAHPRHVVVLVVGSFHMRYGQAVVRMLRESLSAKRVKTLLQLDLEKGQDFLSAIQPHPKYGQHSEYIVN